MSAKLDRIRPISVRSRHNDWRSLGQFLPHSCQHRPTPAPNWPNSAQRSAKFGRARSEASRHPAPMTPLSPSRKTGRLRTRPCSKWTSANHAQPQERSWIQDRKRNTRCSKGTLWGRHRTSLSAQARKCCNRCCPRPSTAEARAPKLCSMPWRNSFWEIRGGGTCNGRRAAEAWASCVLMSRGEGVRNFGLKRALKAPMSTRIGASGGPNFDTSWPMLANICPTLTNIWPNSNKIGRFWPKASRYCPQQYLQGSTPIACCRVSSRRPPRIAATTCDARSIRSLFVADTHFLAGSQGIASTRNATMLSRTVVVDDILFATPISGVLGGMFHGSRFEAWCRRRRPRKRGRSLLKSMRDDSSGGENETTPRQHGVPGRNRLRHSQSLVGPGIFMLQDFWGFPKV